jgi:adenosylcobyric acid synthase
MNKPVKALMFQGTGSDVGKSLLVAGLCRAFVKRGLKVAPFKPQNMSNNAAVTPDGGEIGRAQALQARACGRALSVHMNPVLLKPQSDIGAQIIIQGKVIGNARARDYVNLKAGFMPKVLESFYKVAEGCDLVLVEGAGSAAEVNLRKSDIANMGFAEAADLPVILIGDIDRGGVIASIVGTDALLEGSERTRVKGYLINKFRGDVSLFTSALEIIKKKTDLDSFGIVPFFDKARLLPDEDAMSLDNRKKETRTKAIKIIVPRFARIANFDDLEPCPVTVISFYCPVPRQHWPIWPLYANRVGILTFRPMSGAAGTLSVYVAAIRCWAPWCMTRTGSKAILKNYPAWAY